MGADRVPMGLMAAPPCARCLLSGDVFCGVCAPVRVAEDEDADNCGPGNDSGPFTSAELSGLIPAVTPA